MSDAKGYHKSLYTAMNADAVAQHFYEQGKADALKDSVRESRKILIWILEVHTRRTLTVALKFEC